MKKARKLLITLLILTFVLSTVSVGFAAVNDNSPEVVRAKALGILRGDDKGNLNLDKPITRAEALALIIRISGLEGSADLMKGQTKFADVAADHWASGYINLGVGQSIVNGYPDGTFKPNDNVTYAQMAKMLLYAMNYGVTVEGAPWPAGVMGKADDLGLFDNVNATPNVPALRGDVVKMIDNSLTVKHLKQTGYGDLKSYEEGTDTFLSKMKVDEIDGRVTAVDVKKDQVTVTPDEDETDITKATTYTLLDKTVDVESLLGVAVTVWVNDDDEIFFIDPSMDDVKVDVVDSDVAKDANTIDLRIADDTYDLASDVKVYINGAKSDLEDLKAGMYGSFVFDNDEIIYINVKDWNQVEAGVVKEVKDNIITYFDSDGNDNEIDLDDPDDGYIITLDGKEISADDIEKNDVIYVADYDDMYHIVVVRNAVSGKVDRINNDSVKIDGTTYDIDTDHLLATYSLDEDDSIDVYDPDAASDLTGEEATAILDISGYLRHITSAVDVTSDEIYGVVTRANDYNDNFKIFANGTSTSYDLDGDVYVKDGDDWVAVTDTYDIQALTKAGHYPIVEFKLNKDGEIDDLYVYAVWDGSSNVVSPKLDTVEKPTVVRNNVNVYIGDLVDTKTITVDEFDEDHDSIKTKSNAGTYFITSTTSIVDDIDDMDAVKWEDIEEKTGENATAIVVYNSKNEANLVVFYGNTFDSIADDVEVGVVLDKFVEGGDWKATVRVYDGETADYLLNNKNDVEIGQVIRFKVNSDNEIDLTGTQAENLGVKVYENSTGIHGFNASDVVTEKDGNYLTVGGGVYKVDSATLIYDVTDGLDEIDEARLTDVKANKTQVGLILDDNLIQVLYIVGETSSTPTPSANISATWDDTTHKVNVTVANITGAYAVRIYDYDSGAALGGFTTLSNGTASIALGDSADNPVFITVKVYDNSGNVLATQKVAVQ
ncbi:hypothetical protein DXT63_04640 [Thermoanaerobacteraceae bacterium SP2]|nr:hypothetical protein DXT63_04640 [Thermoanaerobacteraceae bacterium SP2]